MNCLFAKLKYKALKFSDDKNEYEQNKYLHSNYLKEVHDSDINSKLHYNEKKQKWYYIKKVSKFV